MADEAKPPTAIRFAVTGRVPVKAVHGILLADEAHRLAGHELTRAGLADPRRQQIPGSNGAATDHRHAHWVPLVIPGQEPQLVRHRKRESLEDFLTADVRAELGYRDLPPAAVIPAEAQPRLPDRWALEFRRPCGWPRCTGAGGWRGQISPKPATW